MGLVQEDYTLEATQQAVGPGWKHLVTLLWFVCKYKYDPPIMINQVKEKWGGLCFYIGSAPPEVYRLIRKIENLAYKTCEICGAPGKPRRTGWVTTRCDKCQLRWEVDAALKCREREAKQA